MKKLLFATTFALISLGLYAQNADEEAIKKVCKAERQATTDRDLTAWLNCFAQTPDLVLGYSPSLPNTMVQGYDQLVEIGKASIARNPNRLPGTFVHSDHRFRIRGNTAFVTYLSTSTSPDGKQSRTHQTDYLEKENGTWKIVGHFFSTEP